jgi:hypothetical protein
MIHGFLYDTQLLYILVGLLVVFVTTALLSYRMAMKKTKSRTNSELTVNEILPTTILGLLALLLGFTFSMSIARFDARSALVVKEANAIGTAYLRSDLFPVEQGNKYKELLKEYTQHRLSYFEKIRTENQGYTNKSQQLQNQIWKQTVSMTQIDRSALAGTFIQANNDLIDVDSEREFASENHVPELVFYVIIFITTLGLGSLSYNLGLRNQRILTPIVLSLLFSIVIVLIQDLDRPGRGLIRAQQESMERVYKSLN